MIVKMKQFEVWCNNYCVRFKKSWDSYCIANDSWLNGYYKAMEEVKKVFPEIKDVGTEQVEKEFKDGDHQLNTKDELLPKEEQFKKHMKEMYNCKDLRVSMDEKGVISFQGVVET